MIEQILSYRAPFFSIVTTISYVFLPVKSLHATVVTVCISRGSTVSQLLPWPCCWNTPHTASLCWRLLVSLHKHSASPNECQWVHFFFYMGKFNDRALLHTHFLVRHHSVRLPLCCHLSHGNKMKCNIDGKVQPFTAIPPTSASDVMGQHDKIGGITFRAALVYYYLAESRQSCLYCKVYSFWYTWEILQ